MGNTVDILPITKWKRFLIFLSDVLITLIAAVYFFSVAVYPLGREIIHYVDIVNEAELYESQSNDVLFNNKVLFYERVEEKSDYEKCLDATCKRFLSVYVAGASVDNDAVYNYFVTIKHDENIYKSLFKEKYFNLTPSIALKNEYIEPLRALYDEHDELTEAGQELYVELQEKAFLPMYGEVVTDIQKNDLTYNNSSYNSLCQKIQDINSTCKWTICVCAYISFLLSVLIFYLLLPMCFKNKTLTMKILHYERIGIDNLYLLSKKEIILSFVYNTIASLFVVFFTPMFVMALYGVVTVPIILPLSLISIGICIASGIVLLISKFNRTLSDVLTKSVLVKTEELDKIYVAKGYQDK